LARFWREENHSSGHLLCTRHPSRY
jgi:hypothetical protein